MTPLDPKTIDLPTLALLAAVSANEYLLQAVRAAGHPGVRNAHGYLFQHLIDGPRAVGELAERMGVTQQAVSKTALELEEMGYVQRKTDREDTRIRKISITPRGRRLIEQARGQRAALEKELVAALGPRTVNAARRALVTMLEHTGGKDSTVRRRARPLSP